MQKKVTIDAEKILLVKIDEKAFAFNSQSLKKPDGFSLRIGHRLMYNLEDKMLKIKLICTLYSKEKEVLASLETAYHFHIINLEDFYELTEENKPIFNGVIIGTILGIAISTARGILFEKLSNNGIKDIILPVVSPQKILVNQES